MKWPLATLGALVLVAGSFALWVPLDRLFDAFQPLITATSIMIAGILVRLNRGMPTLDWKGTPAESRGRLTQAIVDLNREYLFILALNAAMLMVLVSLTVISKPQTLSWSDVERRGVAAVVGGLLALSGIRVAYMVWRDFDVVRLQKKLIDGAADREALAEASGGAEKVLEAARASNLRRVTPPQVRDWNG